MQVNNSKNTSYKIACVLLFIRIHLYSSKSMNPQFETQFDIKKPPQNLRRRNFNGDPGGMRIPDLLIRSIILALYLCFIMLTNRYKYWILNLIDW